MKNIIQKFITTGHIEGISFLVLLFIAMPLKYFYGMPLAVRIVGSVHGLLFVAYVVLLAAVYFKYQLTVSKSIILFLLSLVPFGTFYLYKFVPAIVKQ